MRTVYYEAHVRTVPAPERSAASPRTDQRALPFRAHGQRLAVPHPPRYGFQRQVALQNWHARLFMHEASKRHSCSTCICSQANASSPPAPGIRSRHLRRICHFITITGQLGRRASAVPSPAIDRRQRDAHAMPRGFRTVNSPTTCAAELRRLGASTTRPSLARVCAKPSKLDLA